MDAETRDLLDKLAVEHETARRERAAEAQVALAKILAGQYEIKSDSGCGCSFDWAVDDDGDLVDNGDADACWSGNGLFVDGEAVAHHIPGHGREIYLEGVDEDDIPDEIWDELDCGYDELPSDEHARCQRESLIEYLICGYELDRDDMRGFANEYTCILRGPYDADRVNTPEDADRWADDYLYDGDAATEAFVDFRYEE